MPDIEVEKATVLYVDDMKTNLVLFQATFEKDYNVILTESPVKGLEILDSHKVQVLVTDQRMPEMTGTELLEIVARDHPEVRRFLLTAFTDFDTVVEAVNKGHIHGYINKPIQADEVRIALNNSLEIYNLRKKNKQIQDELEKANAELLSLDGLKTEIIKVISREIRNPLNRIMGTLHLLKDKIESQELIQVINYLDSSVSRLEEFSSMTEQVSILRSPGHVLQKQEVKVRRLIEYGVVETREKMDEKSIRLDLRVDQEEAVVLGEFHLLVSCFAHLIRNGIEHTHREGLLTMRTGRENGTFRCDIIDTGAEYSEEYLEELKNQYNESGGKFNLNLGMELALAQMIMEAHGGHIRFRTWENRQGCVSMVFKNPGPDE